MVGDSTDSTVRVYRLEVTIPEGSEKRGWQPEGWEEEFGGIVATDSDGAPEYRTFSWPQRRLYLSPSSARKRAELLRRWGATVEISRSEPVRFLQDHADG